MYSTDNEANKSTGKSSSSWGSFQLPVNHYSIGAPGAVTQLWPASSFHSSTIPVLSQRQKEFESYSELLKRKNMKVLTNNNKELKNQVGNETLFSDHLTMYSTDNEANKSTGESSTAQILATSRQTELESDVQERKRKANREAVERSKQRRIQIQNDLKKDVNDLEVKKALMSHEITNLEEEVKELRDNKELKIHVYNTKYFEAEITRLKKKLENQQQKVATGEQQPNNILFNLNPESSSIDLLFNSVLETWTNEFS